MHEYRFALAPQQVDIFLFYQLMLIEYQVCTNSEVQYLYAAPIHLIDSEIIPDAILCTIGI